MGMTFDRKDDYTLVVTNELPPVVTTVAYDYAGLLQQRAAIQAHREAALVARDRELKEVESLIAEADRLGITPRPPTLDPRRPVHLGNLQKLGGKP